MTINAARAGDADRPVVQHLDRLLRHHAERSPEAVAIRAPGLPPLTYGGLREQAGRTARALAAAGIGRADRVAIALPSGPTAATAFVTVACAAVAAPLDPSGRAGEFDFYLADMNARAVIVERRADTAAAAVARVQGRLVLELTALPGGPAGSFDLAAVAPRADGDGAPPGDGAATALILHTSGTTGRPKLVPLTHEIVCTSARNISASLVLTEHDRCLNVLPLFHGHGLMSPLLATLWAGASVACPSAFDAGQFPAWLEEFEPTWFTAVPVIHQAILDVVAARPETLRRGTLRFVRSASAVLSADLREELERTLAVPVIDSYGMTEACSIITSNPLPPRQRKPGSVGISVGNEVAVMDENRALCKAGEVGEIVVRGRTVMRGYEHNPSADAEAFVDGWFRTGDGGYLDEDGYLFLTSRIKEIINRGGTKISPAEVDQVLLSHPAVSEAAAFPLPHPTLGEEVAAAVVMRDLPHADEEEIRAFLAARLAAHKVPRRIFRVTALPRTGTGKVRRSALADQVAPSLRASHDAPSTHLEAVVERVWAELLGADHLGVHEHFFDVGGDSLLARRVQLRLQEEIGRELPLVELFAHPTIKTLSDYLADTAPSTGTAGGAAEDQARGEALARGHRLRAQRLEHRTRQGEP